MLTLATFGRPGPLRLLTGKLSASPFIAEALRLPALLLPILPCTFKDSRPVGISHRALHQRRLLEHRGLALRQQSSCCPNCRQPAKYMQPAARVPKEEDAPLLPAHTATLATLVQDCSTIFFNNVSTPAACTWTRHPVKLMQEYRKMIFKQRRAVRYMPS